MKFPLFLLIGDSFLSEEKRREIIQALKKEWGPALALAAYRTGDVSCAQLLSEARTLPFLAPAQVLILREVERLTKDEIELFGAYFQSPHPQTFFIFEAESLEKGHPFLEGASRAQQLFFLKGGGERELENFIRRKLQGAGKKISPEALDFLQSRGGDSFVFLDSLLDQLILYVGEKTEIDRQAVEALEEKWVQFGGFDLVEALADRNLVKALEIVGELLELNARDFPSLVGLLHWQLRRFREAKKGRLRLTSSEKDSRWVKQLNLFSLPELERILEGLFDLDWRLKTGRAEGRYEVETWLMKAMS